MTRVTSVCVCAWTPVVSPLSHRRLCGHASDPCGPLCVWRERERERDAAAEHPAQRGESMPNVPQGRRIRHAVRGLRLLVPCDGAVLRRRSVERVHDVGPRGVDVPQLLPAAGRAAGRRRPQEARRHHRPHRVATSVSYPDGLVRGMRPQGKRERERPNIYEEAPRRVESRRQLAPCASSHGGAPLSFRRCETRVLRSAARPVASPTMRTRDARATTTRS